MTVHWNPSCARLLHATLPFANNFAFGSPSTSCCVAVAVAVAVASGQRLNCCNTINTSVWLLDGLGAPSDAPVLYKYIQFHLSTKFHLSRPSVPTNASRPNQTSSKPSRSLVPLIVSARSRCPLIYCPAHRASSDQTPSCVWSAPSLRLNTKLPTGRNRSAANLILNALPTAISPDIHTLQTHSYHHQPPPFDLDCLVLLLVLWHSQLLAHDDDNNDDDGFCLAS